MIDFAPLRSGKLTIVALSDGLGVEELRQATNDMIDAMRGLIGDATDADVVFVPDDPDAYDSFAETPEEAVMSWTLGHVIVHTTASAEEAAFQAVELARGVRYRRLRSRYEVPWQSMTSVAQCIHRLEESRRMRLASLDMWPDKPFLNNTYELKYGGHNSPDAEPPQVNAVGRFLLGLKHDDDHLGQIAEIMHQSKKASQAPS